MKKGTVFIILVCVFAIGGCIAMAGSLIAWHFEPHFSDEIKLKAFFQTKTLHIANKKNGR